MVEYVDKRPARMRDDDLVATVRKRLDAAWQHDQENREEAANDLAFLAGDQWPDPVRREREAAKRPMLTINRLPQFLKQVTNDIRQSNLGIKVVGVDGQSDEDMARIYNGLIRQIQWQSSAQHVFAGAAEHQCACGIGWYRVTTQYADDTAFDQELRIEPIAHPMSVYCDPGATKPDRSDAMWMIVTQTIPTEAFEAQYPNASKSDVDRITDTTYSRLYWTTDDSVRIAEYWVKEPYTKTLGLLESGETIDLTDIKPADRAFLPPIVKERQQTAFKVKQYLVSGSEVLDGPNEWPGKYIPVIPVIGSEVPLENKIYRYGLVRYARDPQQLYNYYRTATAEFIALAPKSPYLVTTTMLDSEPIKRLWDTANHTYRPYLPYMPDPAMPGGPKREHPPEMPAALMQEAQIADGDMKATTGIYDAALGAKSNETSGRAILARQREGDVANYHYMDNFEHSLQHCGRVLIDLIPKIYDNERIIRIVGEDDSEDFVQINQVIMGDNGEPILLNDLSAARFDVRVDIGPSYSTKRIETADNLLELIKALPQVGEVAPDLVARAIDFDGADEVAKRLRNIIPPQVLADPDDPPPEPVEVDPGIRIELAEKMAKARKAIAEARKVELETSMLYGQAMLQPEPPLPEPEDIMQDAEPPMPEQGGPPPEPPDMPDIDPAELEALQMGLEPGPSMPLPPQ